jgi:hypothetical protein
LAEQKHITAWCSIFDNKVVKNGTQLFDAKSVGINEFVVAVYKHLQVQYPKFYKMDNLSKLGWLAAEVLLKDNFDKSSYAPTQVAVVLANANASLDSDLKYLESVKDGASPALFVYTLPNIVIGEICIRNGFKGENTFYITEHFDATVMYRQVNEIMDHKAAACICGWVDVLGEDYKAVLFLVETGKEGIPFSETNLKKLFESN